MSDYRDFDTFIEDTENTAELGFTLRGQEFDLPTELPAKLMLRNLRKSKKNPTQEDMIQQYESFFTDLLGEEQYERLLDTGISVPGMNVLLGKLLALYKVGGEEVSPKKE